MSVATMMAAAPRQENYSLQFWKQNARGGGCSTLWKEITLKIVGTGEKIVLPVLSAARAGDVRNLVAKMTQVPAGSIQLMHRHGHDWRRHRAGDEVAKLVLVKGVSSFARQPVKWSHPYGNIGCGLMGLRWAAYCARNGIDYVQFERLDSAGGTAWLKLSNPQSRLQTEAPHYNLAYEPDGDLAKLMGHAFPSFWPSRAEILEHTQRFCDEIGILAHTRFNCEVVDVVVPSGHEHGSTLDMYSFELVLKSTKEEEALGATDPVGHTDWEEEQERVAASVVTHWPGTFAAPNRMVWAGEDTFQGQVAYGFSGEFDYTKVKDQNAALIGMGAFALENVRFFFEAEGKKIYNIARHVNLVMPRVVSWWINQATTPIPSTNLLDRMGKMYRLAGLDPWSMPAVTATEDRSFATIKQETRWGVSDLYFLALYFGRLETIKAEVKRITARGLVLSNGKVLDDVHHIIKALGFTADLAVDAVHHCEFCLGPFPSGDWRRTIFTEVSSIDASRFASVNSLSPQLASATNLFGWLFSHPRDAQRLVAAKALKHNVPDAVEGRPSYVYTPRDAAVNLSALAMFSPEAHYYDLKNSEFKHKSMMELAFPLAFCGSCEEEWNDYCEMFQNLGCKEGAPAYPYNVSDLTGMAAEDEQLRAKDEAAFDRQGEQETTAESSEAERSDGGRLAAMRQQRVRRQLSKPRRMKAEEKGEAIDFVHPGHAIALDPAKLVLQARQARTEPIKSEKELHFEVDTARRAVRWIKLMQGKGAADLKAKAPRPERAALGDA